MPPPSPRPPNIIAPCSPAARRPCPALPWPRCAAWSALEQRACWHHWECGRPRARLHADRRRCGLLPARAPALLAEQELVEAVVLPMTHAHRFKAIGIKPPKGVLLYGPPGTGKTLLARACARQTDAVFLKLAGPQLVQMFIGDGAKVR